MMVEPLVSIICITYNHEKLIQQSLDGFVMQKTNFPFEVIIHDDASTDNTANTIREYEKKYPDIIKPIYQTENQFSKGIQIWTTYIFPQVKGKYVAFCEGDDYWTEPLKLQKQIEYLEMHPECSICFHPVNVICDEDPSLNEIYPSPEWRFNKTVLTINDLVKQNFISTNSVMYRWMINSDNIENIRDIFQQNILPGDWYIHLIHAEKGLIGYIDEVMSVYRKHSGSIWWNTSRNKLEYHRLELYKKYSLPILNFYFCLDKYFEYKYTNTLTKNGLKRFSDMIEIFDKFKEYDKLKILQEQYGKYYLKALVLYRTKTLRKIISAPERCIRKNIISLLCKKMASK